MIEHDHQTKATSIKVMERSLMSLPGTLVCTVGMYGLLFIACKYWGLWLWAAIVIAVPLTLMLFGDVINVATISVRERANPIKTFLASRRRWRVRHQQSK